MRYKRKELNVSFVLQDARQLSHVTGQWEGEKNGKKQKVPVPQTHQLSESSVTQPGDQTGLVTTQHHPLLLPIFFQGSEFQALLKTSVLPIPNSVTE